MRKNVDPSSNKKDTKNNTPFVFDTFSRGTIQDPPASEIKDCFSDSRNLTIFPGFYEGRTGCKLFTPTRFPIIEGRTGYSAHKVGTHIVSDSGNIFTQADVGNFFCWGDIYEYIIEYIGAQEVITETNTFHAGITCSIIGGLNCFDWHKNLKLWILQMGEEFYKADWNIPSWQKMLTISRDKLFNNGSDWSEYYKMAYIFNGRGMFKAEVSASYPIIYKVNINPPDTRIKDIPTFANAACRYRYLYSAARLEEDGIFINRQTPTRIMTETGTNTPDKDNIDFGEIYTRHEISLAYPKTVRTLWVPKVSNTTPQEYEWHLTHFPIWRTFDLEAKDPSDTERTKFNDPQRFVWVKDLRICAAFYVQIDNNIVTAIRGEFEIDDTHSILELENGERYEIVRYIDSKHVRIEYDYYYGPVNGGPYAAAIGTGRVMRGSVTGDILTRTHGDTFSAADIRKTIWNSDGYRMYVLEYLNVNQVRIHLDNDLPVQGFTMDPTHRNFYDTVDDSILRARKDFYTCYGRYRIALPNCSLGKIIPGFVVMGLRTQKRIYSSHLISQFDQLIGQYITIQQNDEIQDAMTFFWLFQNTFVIFCATQTWGFQVGISDFITLPESTESIAVLPGLKLIDKHVGCLDPGSVQEIENGIIQLITNEPGGEAMRQFNGESYSAENYLVDASMGGRIKKALENTKKLSNSIYNGLLGYILWRKNK